jgi:hypothetical protein
MRQVSRHTLRPGHWFIDRRASENGNWEQVYFDNDEQVMQTRIAYWREMRKPPEQWRLVNPEGAVVEIAGLEIPTTQNQKPK